MISKEITKNMEVLTPNRLDFDVLTKVNNLQPFSKPILEFVYDLSRELMKNSESRKFPEIIALANWLRPRSLINIRAHYKRINSAEVQILTAARGVALHFAPANVDTIFLYSTLISFMVGNTNIVRVSLRSGRQLELLVAALVRVMKKNEHQHLRDHFIVIRYQHNDKITSYLSANVDLRVIWGGDSAINTIRAFPLKPRAKDVVFPDRWSLSVLSVDAVDESSSEKLADLARKFCNDSYWFGQMACSSPSLVIWVGSPQKFQSTSQRFWQQVESKSQKFSKELQVSDYVNKFVAQSEAILDGAVSSTRKFNDNIVTASLLYASHHADIKTYQVGGGIFWEKTIDSLEELIPFLDLRSQTLSYFGINENMWIDTLQGDATVHIDRIVPIGSALDFNWIWDGMDLVQEFSRKISLK